MQSRPWHAFLALALFSNAAFADPPPPPQLDRTSLQADVDVLERAYEALHPGLYRYSTPAQTRDHFNALRRDLAHENLGLAPVYLAFSRFAATVRCGHTYANFYNQPKAIRQALFENPDRLPFYFRWLGERMVVTRDLSREQALPPGSEVLSVDGVAAATILRGLLPYARADGANNAKRVALLQVQGEDKYETFDIFLPLVFPQTARSEHQLVVLKSGAARSEPLTVAAQTYAERLAARPEGVDDETKGWRFDLSDPDLAVLRMPDWALYDSKWDWKGFLQTSFEALAKSPRSALVIDLRGNEGGIDAGNEVLPYLVSQPLDVPDPPRFVRYRRVPEDLAPVLDTWDDSFKDWGDAAQPYDARLYRLTRWQDASGVTRIEPRAPHFGGRVFVLIGASNSSATFQFAQQVQQTRLGTLVGAPTGGNRRGINGGAFFFLRLPHSRIELDLPLIATFPEHQPDAGLVPDVTVQPTAADFAAGRDVEMAAVRTALERPKREAAVSTAAAD